MGGTVKAFFAAALCLAALTAHAFPGRSSLSARSGVIKIYVSTLRPDYTLPWQNSRPSGGSGTGFVIAGRKILTNAHLVADARFIQVQKDGASARFTATVEFAAHDCDLAVLSVDDPAFFEGTRALTLSPRTPELNDEVIVLGYPLGGERLSLTRGVVSRLGFAPYSHSGIDQHLVLQVDAAINPGNSGGPVMLDNEVVGLAFQGISWAENIGYAIPQPVVQRFLKDIADGRYHGYPELGTTVMNMRNPALRESLRMPANLSGVAIIQIDPLGAAQNRLRPGDVILTIDRHPLDNDGTILIGKEKFLYAEIIERLQWGDKVTFDIWRDGARQSLTFPLDNPPDPFVFRNQYDVAPRFVIVGGLIFSPLSRDYIRTLSRDSVDANVENLLYLSENAKEDGLHQGRDEFVVFIRRLPHPVNTYLDRHLNGVVTHVNGRPIARLDDLAGALANPTNGYHVIRFMNQENALVMDARSAREADALISRAYNLFNAREGRPPQ